MIMLNSFSRIGEGHFESPKKEKVETHLKLVYKTRTAKGLVTITEVYTDPKDSVPVLIREYALNKLKSGVFPQPNDNTWVVVNIDYIHADECIQKYDRQYEYDDPKKLFKAILKWANHGCPTRRRENG